MTSFVIKLTETDLPSFLQPGHSISWEGQSVSIHITPGDLSLRTISQSARTLSSMINADLVLAGDWNIEQQWAFASAYGGPKSKARVLWCDNTDKQTLEYTYHAFAFARDLINQTPEELSPESLAHQVKQWIGSLAPTSVFVVLSRVRLD